MKDWSGRKQFLSKREMPLIVNNENVGFMMFFQNLWFIGLDKAGHMVPRDLPETSMIILEKFMNGTL
jgi:carboxypeptidase C (cathepsin A)